jgi:hypothetical protein
MDNQNFFSFIAMWSHVEGFCNWSYHLEWFQVILEDPYFCHISNPKKPLLQNPEKSGF